MEKFEEIINKIDLMSYLKGNIPQGIEICCKASVFYSAAGDVTKSEEWLQKLHLLLSSSLDMLADRIPPGHIELNFMSETSAYSAGRLFEQLPNIIESIKAKSAIIIGKYKLEYCSYLIQLLNNIHKYLSTWKQGRVEVQYYVELRKSWSAARDNVYCQELELFQKKIKNWVVNNVDSYRVEASLLFKQIEQYYIHDQIFQN
jgi:hypothetical protein